MPPTQRKASETTSTVATPKAVLTLKADKETKGTVKYTTTADSDRENGGRGTSIYIPKDLIQHVGGLSETITMTIHTA